MNAETKATTRKPRKVGDYGHGKCSICGQRFRKTSGNAAICSEGCRAKHRLEWHRAYYQEHKLSLAEDQRRRRGQRKNSCCHSSGPVQLHGRVRVKTEYTAHDLRWLTPSAFARAIQRMAQYKARMTPLKDAKGLVV